MIYLKQVSNNEMEIFHSNVRNPKLENNLINKFPMQLKLFLNTLLLLAVTDGTQQQFILHLLNEFHSIVW